MQKRLAGDRDWQSVTTKSGSPGAAAFPKRPVLAVAALAAILAATVLTALSGPVLAALLLTRLILTALLLLTGLVLPTLLRVALILLTAALRVFLIVRHWDALRDVYGVGSD
ncbi:MAG: hypothetical protein WA280_01990 [Xanthobacteraceae bacterium]